MSAAAFVLLLLAWAAGGASPGPATLAIAGTSMAQGRAAGLAVAWGIVAGSAMWGMAAALGMGALMAANAWAMEAVRWAGVAYLAWLGSKALRAAATARPLADAEGRTGTLPRLFGKGLAVHLTNPKPILGWGAIFAVAVPPGAGWAVVAETYAALLAVSVAVFTGYAVLFSTPRAVAAYQAARRGFDLATGVFFGAAALGLARSALGRSGA